MFNLNLNDEVRKVKTMNDLKQFAVNYVTIQTAKDFGDKLKLNPTTVKNYLKMYYTLSKCIINNICPISLPPLINLNRHANFQSH